MLKIGGVCQRKFFLSISILRIATLTRFIQPGISESSDHDQVMLDLLPPNSEKRIVHLVHFCSNRCLLIYNRLPGEQPSESRFVLEDGRQNNCSSWRTAVRKLLKWRTRCYLRQDTVPRPRKDPSSRWRSKAVEAYGILYS